VYCTTIDIESDCCKAQSVIPHYQISNLKTDFTSLISNFILYV